MLFHFSIHSSDALVPTVITYPFLTIKHAISILEQTYCTSGTRSIQLLFLYV